MGLFSDDSKADRKRKLEQKRLKELNDDAKKQKDATKRAQAQLRASRYEQNLLARDNKAAKSELANQGKAYAKQQAVSKAQQSAFQKQQAGFHKQTAESKAAFDKQSSTWSGELSALELKLKNAMEAAAPLPVKAKPLGEEAQELVMTRGARRMRRRDRTRKGAGVGGLVLGGLGGGTLGGGMLGG